MKNCVNSSQYNPMEKVERRRGNSRWNNSGTPGGTATTVLFPMDKIFNVSAGTNILTRGTLEDLVMILSKELEDGVSAAGAAGGGGASWKARTTTRLYSSKSRGSRARRCTMWRCTKQKKLSRGI